MGFSVSGSVVVVLLGLFIALGTFYTSGANTMERLSEAEADRADHLRHVQESAVNVTSVTITDDTACDIGITATNTGSTTLALPDVDLLLDNVVVTDWQDAASVDGDSDTDLWLPGEQLVVNRTDRSTAPDHTKLVTGVGVTSTRSTEGLTC